MGMAESMRGMTEDIIASYDIRVGFAQEQKRMREEQDKDLANLISRLSKNVGSMLKGFQNDHATMSEELKNRLAKEKKEMLRGYKDARVERSNYVKDIVSNVKDLLGEYRSDIRKASAAWKGMTTTLARARKKGVMARSEAGEKMTTVEEAIKKGKERKGK